VKKSYIYYTILAVAVILIWHYSAKSNNVRLLISSPKLVYDYFLGQHAMLLNATWVTFYEAFLGLLLAVMISFLTMTLCLYIPKLMKYFLPIMIICQVIPLITLAPFFLIWLGIGPGSKIAMAAVICYFPIFINFANGVRLISDNIHELLFINNATKTQAITKVFIPLALPNIMTGLKIASTLAVIGAVVGEFSGAEIGLGRNLFITAVRIDPELMMSSLLLSSLLGGVMFVLIYLLEKKLGKWYQTNNH